MKRNKIKTWLILLTIFFSVSCKKDADPTTELITSILVEPSKTDGNYSPSEQSHYVVRNNTTHLNKLLLFVGGSYSIPKDYYLICSHAASIGLDVISLSFPNGVATAPLGTSSDKAIFDNYREELCFGNSVSNEVDINLQNCILTRATKLMLFLIATYSDQNWSQYVNSEGSGHACYLGKKMLVDRVLMFSGHNDYSTYYSSPGTWLTQLGKTSLAKQFRYFIQETKLFLYSNQVANLKGLGLLSPLETPLLADQLATPYSNAHVLSLNIPAISFHSSTIGGNSVLPSIWTYMLIGK